MMQTIVFHSWVSDRISRFIELRRLSGTDYSSQVRLLAYFDRFLVEHYPSGPAITRQIVDHYLQSLSGLQSRGRSNRFCVVRQLCEYIARTDPCCHVPEPMRGVNSQKAFCPLTNAPSKVEDKQLRAKMEARAKRFARPEAAKKIAEAIIAIALEHQPQ